MLPHEAAYMRLKVLQLQITCQAEVSWGILHSQVCTGGKAAVGLLILDADFNQSCVHKVQHGRALEPAMAFSFAFS